MIRWYGPALAIILAGCGGGSSSSSPDAGPAAPTIKEVDASKLPPLADPLPDLDNGRVSCIPPLDWHVLGRNQSYVAAFSKAKGSQIPLIQVKASDPRVSGFENVNGDNVLEYTAAVKESLKNQHGEKLSQQIAESPRAMKIGDNYFVRYVKNAVITVSTNAQKISLHIQVLETIQNGRQFSVELQVIKGAVAEDRDFAYSVGSGLKFKMAKTESIPSPAPAADKKSGASSEKNKSETSSEKKTPSEVKIEVLEPESK